MMRKAAPAPNTIASTTTSEAPGLTAASSTYPAVAPASNMATTDSTTLDRFRSVRRMTDANGPESD